MRFLRLTLAPDLVPMDEGVKRIEILNNQYLPDGTMIELSRIESTHDVEALFEENSGTIAYELLAVEGDAEYVFHHFRPEASDFPQQFFSLPQEYRLLFVYPIRFDRDTGNSVTLIGTTDMVQEAYGRLPPEIQRHITIEQVTETMPTLGGVRSTLTDRQREVLDTAIELGYYAVPRRVTATGVADVVGCSPSTASEHLRKIESRVLTGLGR